MVIGIDVGISTTKIVGINDDHVVISPIRIRATDPVTSLYGAFGKYLYDNQIALSEVEHVMITGVGAAYVNNPIYGLPTDKAEELIWEINNSSVTDQEKKFLIEAAKRHNVFNYRLIAEYYATASKEMQGLMERSALVIIDIDNAIANGYVKLSERVKKLMQNG